MNNSSGSSADLIPLLVMLIFIAGMMVLAVFIWGTIFKKAGYSFWMGLLMFIPLVNIIWLLVFAFSTWPIHRELEMYRSHGGYPTGGFPVTQPPPMQ